MSAKDSQTVVIRCETLSVYHIKKINFTVPIFGKDREREKFTLRIKNFIQCNFRVDLSIFKRTNKYLEGEYYLIRCHLKFVETFYVLYRKVFVDPVGYCKKTSESLFGWKM